MALNIPPFDVPFVDTQTGKVNPTWYDFMRSITRIKTTDLTDVAATAPTNGQVLVYSTTTLKYAPGSN